MKFVLSERAHTAVIVVVGLVLFFHPHVGPQPFAKAADCLHRAGSMRTLTLSSTARRQYRFFRICDRLTIINAGTRPIYPAPGPHPNHQNYPELDPKVYLHQGDSFHVQLDRPGNYQLHDHDTERILVDFTVVGWVR